MPISVTSRITSEHIRIEFLPGSLTEETHVETFAFDSAVDGGTFKIWYNGETTAAITFDATPATLITNVNAALDALANTSAGDLVMSGSVITTMVITATGLGNGFVRLLSPAANETSLTQGTPNVNPKLEQTVTTQGAAWAVLSAEASSFSWERSVETVDVTAISEYDRLEIPVAEAVSFDISLYKLKAGSASWIYGVYAGNNGLFWVFPEGKEVGKENFQFKGLIESNGEDYPDHEKVEIELSGMRQGAFTIEPNSIYRI